MTEVDYNMFKVLSELLFVWAILFWVSTYGIWTKQRYGIISAVVTIGMGLLVNIYSPAGGLLQVGLVLAILGIPLYLLWHYEARYWK